MIDAIGGLAAAAPSQLAPRAEAVQPGFVKVLSDAVERVDQFQKQGDDALTALASGREVDLHGAMISMQEAEIALRAMVSVRDKLVGAYEQIMNLAI